MIVYSKNHAVKILEILNEIFNDIDEHSSSGSSITFNEEFFFTGLEELLFCDYIEFQEDLPDPDTLPERVIYSWYFVQWISNT